MSKPEVRYFVTDTIEGDFEVVGTGTPEDLEALRAEMQEGQSIWRAVEVSQGPKVDWTKVPVDDLARILVAGDEEAERRKYEAHSIVEYWASEKPEAS